MGIIILGIIIFIVLAYIFIKCTDKHDRILIIPLVGLLLLGITMTTGFCIILATDIAYDSGAEIEIIDQNRYELGNLSQDSESPCYVVHTEKEDNNTYKCIVKTPNDSYFTKVIDYDYTTITYTDVEGPYLYCNKIKFKNKLLNFMIYSGLEEYYLVVPEFTIHF